MTLILTRENDEWIVYKGIDVRCLKLPSYEVIETSIFVELPRIKDTRKDKDEVIKILRAQIGEEIIYKESGEIDRKKVVPYDGLINFLDHPKILKLEKNEWNS